MLQRTKGLCLSLIHIYHLYSLNVAGTWQEGNQEPIMDSENKDQIGIVIKSRTKLTEFGELFVRSCVPDEFALEADKDSN